MSTETREHVVTIYGASDDLIEVDGHATGCDEYSGEDKHLVLVGPRGKVRVRCWYTKRGVWAIAVAPVDEGSPMLPVVLSAAENGYSAQATVDGVELVVPEGESPGE